MKKVNFEVKYEAGHSYNEEWQITENHCPNCGKKEVWNNNSCGGDYYMGEMLRCKSCGCEFYLPTGAEVPSNKDWQARQRADFFKAI